MTLNGQVALVTGAGSGIGEACALALAEAGATVVAADINLAAAQVTADKIAGGQKRAMATPVDVGDLDQIDAMVRKAIEAYGQIDIVVNNAGVTRSADIMDLTEAQAGAASSAASSRTETRCCLRIHNPSGSLARD